MEKYWDFNNGVLTIYGGRGTKILPTRDKQPWLDTYKKNDITKIEFIGEGLSFPRNSAHWFNQYTNVTEIIGLEKVSTANVTDMASMFSDVHSLTELDVSNFDTSNVTNMYMMFYNMQNLKELDLSGFDMSNVKYMSYMFYNMQNLTSIDISNFDTSNVTSMSDMFGGTTSLPGLP